MCGGGAGGGGGSCVVVVVTVVVAVVIMVATVLAVSRGRVPRVCVTGGEVGQVTHLQVAGKQTTAYKALWRPRM